MGWKNIKEHYRISHIVHVRDEGICIGSPYVSELIIVSPDGDVKWGSLGPGGNEELDRYHKEMTADRAKVIELLNTPDTFTKSVTVYTFKEGEIIEKQCEETGWPNITHDGQIMYGNSFSTDKSKVVEWAKRNAQSGIELVGDSIQETKKRLAELEQRHARYTGHLAKLNADYPEATQP